VNISYKWYLGTYMSNNPGTMERLTEMKVKKDYATLDTKMANFCKNHMIVLFVVLFVYMYYE